MEVSKDDSEEETALHAEASMLRGSRAVLPHPVGCNLGSLKPEVALEFGHGYAVHHGNPSCSVRPFPELISPSEGSIAA